MERRVVITGMGIVSALGNSPMDAFARLHTYQNAVQTLEELTQFKGLNAHLGAPVTNFVQPEHYTRKVIRTMGRVAILALYATEQAIAQAGLAADEISSGRLGVAYGSSSGSIASLFDFYTMLASNEVKNITSSTYIKMMPQTTAVNLSVHFKTTGRLIPTGTACTSGSLAIGNAYEAIKFGTQDMMIAGGAEEFNPTQVAIFDTLYATSLKNDAPQTTPMPFDKNRDGLVIGEGAATLILEEYEHAKARGATILAEIIGFGSNTDGTHVTQPNHVTMNRALAMAVSSAGISPDAIGYVNAHGTATPQGDVAETTATRALFQREIPISSLKSYIGHTLGACGAIEAVLSILMMNNDWFAPTLNLKTIDPACGALDYIRDTGRVINTDTIMSNNFAFGGVNTSLIFKRS